jgi:hypothetical protein
MVRSEVKYLRYGAVGKPSLNRACEQTFTELHAIDPKPGDLSMARMKLR